MCSQKLINVLLKAVFTDSITKDSDLFVLLFGSLVCPPVEKA